MATPIKKIKTAVLIKDAFKAIIQPHKAFRKIPSVKINYKIVIPLMAAASFVSSILHLSISYGIDLKKDPFFSVPLIISHTFYGLIIWLLGTLGVLFIAKLFKKKVKIEKIEIAIFYIWLGWAITPLFSALRFVFHWQGINFHLGNIPNAIGIYIGLFFIIPFLIVESFFLLKYVLRLKGKEIVLAGIFAISLPFIIKLGLHELPFYVSSFFLKFFGTRILPISFLFLLMVSTAGIILIVARLSLERKIKEKIKKILSRLNPKEFWQINLTKPALITIFSISIILGTFLLYSYKTENIEATFTCNSGTLSTTCNVNAAQTMANGETVSGTGNLVIQNGGNLTTAAGNSFTISMGGTVTIQSGGTITGNLTNLTAANLDIQSGGSININAIGYAGGATGAAGSTCTSCGGGGGGASGNSYGGGGAGHGANGGAGNNGTAGSSYGDSTQPTALGSGGGGATPSSCSCNGAGGNGGGAVKFTISGTTTINGAITSNGGNGSSCSCDWCSGGWIDIGYGPFCNGWTTVYAYGGGGSGGSAYITTGTLAGTANIAANGGTGTTNGGGGAGGRIALFYDTKTYSGSTTVSGGAGYVVGGTGTSVESYSPTVPQTPWCEGETNPTTVTDSTPEFSAIFDDPNTGDHADYYQIQVGTDADWTVAEMWDSTKTANTDQTLENARCVDISYAGTALASSTTYYWRIKFWDNYGGQSVWSATQQFTTTSFNPGTSWCEGETNPTTVTDSTPEFSAVFTDIDPADHADSYEVEVGTDDNWSVAEMWDTGKTANADQTVVNARCADISYAGTALQLSVTYYWRIRFWDNHDNQGDWSATQHFITSAISVSTLGIADLTANSVTLHGSLDNLSVVSQAKVWFEWGTTVSYGSETTKETKDSVGTFTVDWTDLTQPTYYFRAKASRTDDTNVVSGTGMSFSLEVSNGFTADHKWAWGENTGWKNFQPTHGGVVVYNGGVVDYLWAENIGWINLDYDGIPGAINTSATNWGVVNDGNGNLSGYAWGENVGWINFDPTHSQVVIDSSGNFSGYAWGENIGWIHFDHDQTDYTPKTSWASSSTPTPPTSLQSEGQTNPAVITDMTPDLSAIYNDPQTNDTANKYRIQVDDNSNFLSAIWDSGVNGTSMTNCSQGNRCSISYIGDQLTKEVKYYWRIKFWDDEDHEGNWSTEEAYFTLFAPNFEADHKWAWGENTGWKNFQPTHGGMVVTDYGLTGYIWAENIGWINLDYDGIPGAINTSATNWGVVNDGNGNLSGYAWGENVGWINFDSTHSQVVIDSSGNFAGYAWAENIGWIHFDHDQTDYTPKTSWRLGVPLIGSVSDSPDPQTGGSNITFTASGVSDTQSRSLYLYICSDSSYTKCDPANPSGWYFSPTGPFSSPYSSVIATKACGSCDYADSSDYWARVCTSTDSCSQIVPAGGNTFTCKKGNECSCNSANGESAQCYGGYCCNGACKSENCPYVVSGYIISSTFDTQITGGVAYNSIMWEGTEPEGTNVQLQLATSSSSSGPWTFYGGSVDSCATNEYYGPAPNTPTDVRCYSVDNNKRYFRYKVILYSDVATHKLTPIVTKVIVNYSP